MQYTKFSGSRLHYNFWESDNWPAGNGGPALLRQVGEVWSSRLANNQESAGSNPAPAPNFSAASSRVRGSGQRADELPADSQTPLKAISPTFNCGSAADRSRVGAIHQAELHSGVGMTNPALIPTNFKVPKRFNHHFVLFFNSTTKVGRIDGIPGRKKIIFETFDTPVNASGKQRAEFNSKALDWMQETIEQMRFLCKG